MPNAEHVAILKQGRPTWNAWRENNPHIRPDLRDADLSRAELFGVDFIRADLRGVNLNGTNLILAKLGAADLNEAKLGGAKLNSADFYGAKLGNADLSYAHLYEANFNNAMLSGADLSFAKLSSARFEAAVLEGAKLIGADLSGAKLSGADLIGADISRAKLGRADLQAANLKGANLSGAMLIGADLSYAGLSKANLSGARLRGANLSYADLSKANLSGADLSVAHLVHSNLTDADLTGCHIFGISAWDLELEGAKQENLVISSENGMPAITVDNIEVAQFIYLMIHNHKIRGIIDTITSKAVLILGRFSDERKAVLDALREELRSEYLPILFDFEKPRSLGTDETITLLARMARFIIADITDAKSVLQELRAIVPDLPSVPVQPIILATQEEPGMFDFYRNRPSVLSVHRYATKEQLLADLSEKVILPAVLKAQELRG